MSADDEIVNPSHGPRFTDLLALAASRRQLLKLGAAGAALALFGRSGAAADAPAAAAAPAAALAGLPGFTAIATSTEDTVRVPPGYEWAVLTRWGDPVGAQAGQPRWRSDAGNDAAEQALQFGMHHDGMALFPLGTDGTRALLALNHEYVDHGLLFADGMDGWSAAKVAKSMAAHGVSVVELVQAGERWSVVSPSQYGRRITAATPMRLAGPAAGHALLATAADPQAQTVLGTFNNCACGQTPWGTYLSCEENFNGYFARTAGEPTALEKRYGIREKSDYRWHEHEPRFDSALHPNEAHRFGWVVEIDPHDPAAVPVKRTALGRFKHENAAVTLAADGRVVVYLGDDQANEYLYRYVSKGRYTPGMARAAAGALLDDGILSVAHFGADGHGEWRALVHGRDGLDAGNGFADQAEVLVKTRLAADVRGATKLDRTEWVAIHPGRAEVAVTLTNNSGRKSADAADPRAPNPHGHILRWRPDGADHAADGFAWEVFVLAGDPQAEDASARGNQPGLNAANTDAAFSSPDGLAFDARGLLWIETDVSTGKLWHPQLAPKQGAYQVFGNNQLLVANPDTGEIRRFLTGPVGCELTGIAFSPDLRTLFVNIQHPGEPLDANTEFNDPAAPQRWSQWPDGPGGGRPRSATLAIRRTDGGPVGS